MLYARKNLHVHICQRPRPNRRLYWEHGPMFGHCLDLFSSWTSLPNRSPHYAAWQGMIVWGQFCVGTQGWSHHELVSETMICFHYVSPRFFKSVHFSQPLGDCLKWGGPPKLWCPAMYKMSNFVVQFFSGTVNMLMYKLSIFLAVLFYLNKQVCVFEVFRLADSAEILMSFIILWFRASARTGRCSSLGGY